MTRNYIVTWMTQAGVMVDRIRSEHYKNSAQRVANLVGTLRANYPRIKDIRVKLTHAEPS